MIKKMSLVPAIVKIILRVLVSVSVLVMKKIQPKKVKSVNLKRPVEVILTGTFFSENWILNHLRPLAASQTCGKVILVTTFPLPQIDKVEYVNPPAWQIKLLGKVPARLLTFISESIKRKPAFIGGFHLLLNGLLAGVLARVTGGKSIYFCGGGPREVLDGGIHGSTLFGLMKKPDRYLEKKLIEATKYIDLIICMGVRTIEFFRKNGVTSTCVAIPGGILPKDNHITVEQSKPYDIIFVGRLESVKRVDILISAVKILAQKLPSIRIVIVGTGSLETELKELVRKLDLQKNINFTGYQQNVFSWLQQSKIFAITSDSEGLPLALMEAMTAGLPCVVSDVGELGEIVENGENGFLVNSRNPEIFAECFLNILSNESFFQKLSKNALETASKFSITKASDEWDKVLPIK